MGKALTTEQVNQYHNDGFLFPFDVFTESEAAGIADRFAEMERNLGEEMQSRFRNKAQLPFPWLCDLVANERLLDAVEDLIGPDILCWGSSFFTKKARDPRFISWHADDFVYGFEPAETVTAWLAFHPSTVESGCVQYIPGSHHDDPTYEFIPDPNNLARNGQHAIGINEDDAVFAVLKAGEVVFHHQSVVHSSGPNNADHPRVGLAIHYTAPNVRETRFNGATATLLRGEDKYGFWGKDPVPEVDFDKNCIEHMEQTRAIFAQLNNKKIESVK
ncbi:MAG: hypothetical protein CMM52_05905 [Rhodospirillaceae bacterium]|nr:hypothetical protein [Rhodospirillaceae bacterium]|tara:strand:+ start:23623 stop:24444 length:822 start_codon:yes stop_codon:yes gene_type:complete